MSACFVLKIPCGLEKSCGTFQALSQQSPFNTSSLSLEVFTSKLGRRKPFAKSLASEFFESISRFPLCISQSVNAVSTSLSTRINCFWRGKAV